MKRIFYVVVILILMCLEISAQSPQTQDVANTEPLFRTNSSWANGVAPGYWPTCTNQGATTNCPGLTLYLGPATIIGTAGKVTYVGGTLVAVDNTAHQYVRANSTTAVPFINTTPFSQADGCYVIADIVTSGGRITVINDDRTQFCPGSGGSGTVASVAETFTGGLISVAGSPITTSGTLALTVAGTSGGIPYFSGASTWSSSGALTANLPVIGGGAGTTPTVGTRSGNTTDFATTTGSLTSGNCVELDANGNFVDAGSPCGGGGGGTQVVRIPIDFQNPQTFTNNGNAGWTVFVTVNNKNEQGGWRMVAASDGCVFGQILVPHNVDATPAPSAILRFFPTGTATANVRIEIADAVVTNSSTYDVSYTVETAQTVAIPAINTRFDVTFTPSASIAADEVLRIRACRRGTNGADTYAGDLAMEGGQVQITEDF